ncbi:MAG: hypothetical protein QOH67_3642 [Hyphomicrobiales bacterium]|jgi:hypothetical protein|nr:hypothetical protein [Hyphomicrobiales bacterium]
MSVSITGISRRRLVFFYDLVWIAVLGIIAWKLLHANNCLLLLTPGKTPPAGMETFCALWIKYKIFFNCMWMGALGGLTISLKGVYDHGNPADPWKDAYNLWHIGRPVSGAIAGMIAGLLFLVFVPEKSFSFVVLYGVAFIFGMQDRAFFDFLSTFAGRFLPKSDQATTTALQVTGVTPPEGKAGAEVRIAGQGIDKNAVVRIGGAKLGALVVAPDGTSASGTVPKLTVPKDTKVDLEVINPGGRSIVLLEGFKYLGD